MKQGSSAGVAEGRRSKVECRTSRPDHIGVRFAPFGLRRSTFGSRLSAFGIQAQRRAALLLEVIVALTILVAAMGLLGAQLVAGLKLTAAVEDETRATQLADRMLALLELDPTTIQAFFNDQKTDGDFGDAHPGWFWKATVEPMEEFPGLGQITIEVLKQEDADNLKAIDDARVVRRLHMIKAEPGRINLEEDFGIEQEIIDAIAQNIPIPGFDPNALNIQELVAMDPLQLMAMLPQLMPLIQQFMGGGGGNLPPELAALLGGMGGGGGGLPGIPGLGGGGGAGGGGSGNPQADFLRNFIQQALGDKVSPEQLDQMMNNLPSGGGGFPGGGGRGPGGGRGGAGGGEGDDGSNGPPPPNDNPAGGLGRDFMRDFIRSQLGDQVSDEQLEEMLNNMPDQGGGGNAGGQPPRTASPGGAAGGGNRGGQGGNRGGGSSGNGGRTIRDFNDQRNNNNGGKRN